MIDLTGQTFDRLTVVGRAHKNFWACKCSCGNEKAIRGPDLRHGRTRSCGCLHKERFRQIITTHGLYKSHRGEYRAWEHMRRRCQDPNSPAFKNYGGRGISVCERWESFENFMEDMGPRPSPSHSIDRHPNNDGNYEPGNCRWATRVEQNNNTRTNRMVEYRGEVLTLSEAIRKSGSTHRYGTILRRLQFGWPLERALTERTQHRSVTR